MVRVAQSKQVTQQQPSAASGDRRTMARSVPSWPTPVGQRATHLDSSPSVRGLAQMKEEIQRSPRVQSLLRLAQPVEGTRAPALAQSGQIDAPTTVQRVQSGDATIQFGRTKRRPRKSRGKSKKKGSETYAGCEFTKTDPVMTQRVMFFGRPPSNSRGGQGDHIVAYSLIMDAVARAVAHKQLGAAGAGLAALITDSKTFVKTGAINKWWHTAADGLIEQLNGIDPSDPDMAKAVLQRGVSEAVKLLNMMPGTAKKNKSSTGGHGEGSIEVIETSVVKGKVLRGNPWTNVLGLIDLNAEPGLLSDDAKLTQKLTWLLTLFKHAAPTAIRLLKNDAPDLLPDANLQNAVNDKVGPGLASIGVTGIMEAWLAAL